MELNDEQWIFLSADDTDIYSDPALERMVDDDEITAEEAAFMQGYNEAG